MRILSTLLQTMAGCVSHLSRLQRRIYHVLICGSVVPFFIRTQHLFITRSHTPCIKLHGRKCFPISQTFVSGQLLCCGQIQKLHYVSHKTNVNVIQEGETEELKSKLNSVSNKIIFNSVLEFSKFEGDWKKRRVLKDRQEKLKVSKINKKDRWSNIPVALKYITDTPEIHATNKNEIKSSESENEIVCLPYGIETELNTLISAEVQQQGMKESIDLPDQQMFKSELDSSNWTEFSTTVSNSGVSSWMSDYECYDENGNVFKNTKPWEMNYGTPDITTPISDVPCGGCGAMLHCQVISCKLQSVGHLILCVRVKL